MAKSFDHLPETTREAGMPTVESPGRSTAASLLLASGLWTGCWPSLSRLLAVNRLAQVSEQPLHVSLMPPPTQRIGAGLEGKSRALQISSDIVGSMSDMLIRDIPDDVLRALEARAATLGLSRSQYVHRRLAQDAKAGMMPVVANDLVAFATTFADLADPQVMDQAWR